MYKLFLYKVQISGIMAALSKKCAGVRRLLFSVFVFGYYTESTTD